MLRPYTKKVNSDNRFNLYIGGASISKCPWITWVDLLRESLRPTSVIDHSCKGAGNQYIVRSIIHALDNNDALGIVAVMFTNFDKYDMWVSGARCQDLKSQKHPPVWLDGSPAIEKGFWCTGSHYPLIKEIYQNNFFDLEMSASQDLINFLALVKFCDSKFIPLVIMFDSPVLDYTEYQINQWCKNRIPLENHNLRNSELIDPFIKVLDPYLLDTQGLIGFCLENDLLWYNKCYGPHPPSNSHYLYFQKKALPWIKKHYPDLVIKDIDPQYETLIDKMTIKWQNNGF